MNINQRVIELAAEQVGVAPGEVTPAHHFINDLEFDSLDVVEFGMKVEDEFAISISDDQIQKLQTVGQVIEYIEQHPAQPKTDQPTTKP